MIDLLLLGAVAIAAFVAAAWLHELTHAAAVKLLGGEVVDVDLVELHTDYRFDPPAPVRERLVLLAPGLVGLASAPLLALLWRGPMTAWTAIGAVAWVIYTLNGGTNGELRLPTGDSRPADASEN